MADEEAVEPEADAAEPEQQAPEPELGLAGKKALEAERRARRAAEREAKEKDRVLAEERARVEREVAALKAAAEAAEAKAAERARAAAERDAYVAAVKAGVAEPDVLFRPMVTLDDLLGDDGNVDETKAAEVFGELVKARPWLRGVRPLEGGGARDVPASVASNQVMNQILREGLSR